MEDQITLVKDQKEGDEKVRKCWMPYVPRRYIIAAFMFLGAVNSFTVRVNFNVALVAMANYTDDEAVNSTFDQCPGPALTSNKTETTGYFNWDHNKQSILLGAYYYGYPLLQPLGGYLADRFGAKWLIASTGITAGILNLLLPTIASWNFFALVVLRTLLGLGQGPLWPSMAAMVSWWIPASERVTIFAIINGGCFIGTVVSQSISGVLCDSAFLGGWPAAFYLFGTLSLVWSVAFILLTSDSPATYPSISDEERHFILAHIGDTKYMSAPWKSIFTSKPFLVFFFILVLDLTAFDIVFTFLPLYMKRVLKYDMSQSGVLASLPYVTSFIVTSLAGSSSDIIRNKGWLGTMWIRRIYTILGELSMASMVLVISMVGCDRVAVIICFLVYISAGGMNNGGYTVNVYDIAPRYAGSLFGVANGVGNIGGFVGPLVVGALTNDSGNLDSWKMVFYLIAGLQTLGCLVFCVFGSGDVQAWAKPKVEEPTEGHSQSIQIEDPPQINSPNHSD